MKLEKLVEVDGFMADIIDIDYYNHVYVNPVDMTVRSYWHLILLTSL